VADKCRFKDTNQPTADRVALDRQRKNRTNNKTGPDSGDELDIEGTRSDDIDTLGYMPSNLIFDLTSEQEVRNIFSIVRLNLNIILAFRPPGVHHKNS
jgi:hypothetical protein